MGHSYKVGDRVVVWNQTFGGEPIREGEATVRRLLDREDTYMVRFDGDGPRDLYERCVRAAGGSDRPTTWTSAAPWG